MKKIIIGAVVVIVLVIAGYLLLAKKGSGITYLTEPVSRGNIETTVSASGTLDAVTTVQVGTQVSGKIKDLYADFNSKVTKGEVIAEIDPSLFQAQVDQARANLANARATLVKNQAILVDAERTRDRYRQLLARHLVSQSDLDTAETNYETAKATVDASQTAIAQAQAALSLAETNLHYTKIVSPVDGVVISRNVDVGQTVAASFQTPTLFTIAADLTKMQIDTSVDEADIGSVRVGQDVDFTVDAYPEETFKGTVFQVRNAAVTVQNVVTYDVVVKVANPELKLKPGMTADVSIITSRLKDVLRIPNAALRFVPAAKAPASGLPMTALPPSAQGPSVWVLENGRPRRVAVTVGPGDSSYTELLSGDLHEGEGVIVEAQSKSGSRRPSGPRFF
jgi:HlyD family secretion protein